MVANTMKSAEARIYALAAEHGKDKEPRRTNNRNVSEETFCVPRAHRIHHDLRYTLIGIFPVQPF